MTSRDAHWYNLQRAQDAKKRSQEASDPAIAALHMEFYQLYMKRASEGLTGSSQLTIAERP